MSRDHASQRVTFRRSRVGEGTEFELFRHDSMSPRTLESRLDDGASTQLASIESRSILILILVIKNHSRRLCKTRDVRIEL